MPAPTKNQLMWHDMEYYLFMHFGPNTFTDLEWGHGDEKSSIFNPVEMDCNQWCKIAKDSGAKEIIITAKHHDGFCLWPSKYSDHTVAQSIWRNGKGDVLKELSQACKAYGLKFGVYISPWDRNHPDYGTEKYNDIFVGMMEEIFDQYGPVWELWWDGANGEGPNGKRQEYNWSKFVNLVRGKSPNTVIFSDVGPDVRWVGNEQGIACTTNWNMLNTAVFSPGIDAPSTDSLCAGNINGSEWVPAECDVSIRPGWFYHSKEDEKVKSPEALFDIYLKSVGRGANLLINVPPDRRGMIYRHDSLSLLGFKKLLNVSFSHNLLLNQAALITTETKVRKSRKLTDNRMTTSEFFNKSGIHQVSVRLARTTPVNCIQIFENLTKGQNISSAVLHITDMKGSILHTENITTIGQKRILTFPMVKAGKIILNIQGQHERSGLKEISAFYISESLISSSAHR